MLWSAYMRLKGWSGYWAMQERLYDTSCRDLISWWSSYVRTWKKPDGGLQWCTVRQHITHANPSRCHSHHFSDPHPHCRLNIGIESSLSFVHHFHFNRSSSIKICADDVWKASCYKSRWQDPNPIINAHTDTSFVIDHSKWPKTSLLLESIEWSS